MKKVNLRLDDDADLDAVLTASAKIPGVAASVALIVLPSNNRYVKLGELMGVTFYPQEDWSIACLIDRVNAKLEGPKD